MRQSETVICRCTDNTTVKTKVAKRQLDIFRENEEIYFNLRNGRITYEYLIVYSEEYYRIVYFNKCIIVSVLRSDMK